MWAKEGTIILLSHRYSIGSLLLWNALVVSDSPLQCLGSLKPGTLM